MPDGATVGEKVEFIVEEPFIELGLEPTAKYAGFWERFKQHRSAYVSLWFIMLLTVIAIIPGYFAPQDPTEIKVINPDERFISPSFEHIMGTDELGRDIFSRVIYGVQVSLMVGFIAVVISFAIGVSVGALSGYYGGKLDKFLMAVTDVFLVIPGFFLILLIIAIYGSSIYNVMIVIGLLSWMSTARIVRAEFLTLREMEFVEAAKSLGAGDTRIVFKHILPNALAPAIINSSLLVASAILIEAGLSFLGLGDPNRITWGQMLANSQGFQLAGYWWMTFFPGLAIFATVLAFNLIGDGLNDAFNPRLRGR
jgi:peptide/nickel transport system permease protein